MRVSSVSFAYTALAAACALAPLVLSSRAQARPSGPAGFCAQYPDSASCAGRGITCTTCHTSTSPTTPDWNNYGLDVLAHLVTDFDADLPAALAAIEGEDDDGDGLTNLEEIVLGTLPGDASSHYTPPPAPSGATNPEFDVGNWDARFAARRMVVAFCGRSPTAAELETVVGTPAQQRAIVHAGLDACLASPYWLNEGLSRLADEKIRPIDFTTAFDWDYRLWRYQMSGDRDVRDLLLAQYHVREAQAGVLTEVSDVVDEANPCPNGDGDCSFDHFCTDEGVCRYRGGIQPLVPSERAGMIGTTWFHFINTMFSAMPRTTAAQAMRAYLGVDIARQQGIAPVTNEPLDVDGKNVAQPECAQCHSTLDPATYAFAKYNGIEPGGSSLFDPLRPQKRGLWDPADEPQGMLLGQPVSSLREWAAVAAASDEFRYHLAKVLFEYAVGHPPGPADNADFEVLWRSWGDADVAYSANEFLHKLVDTDTFGAP